LKRRSDIAPPLLFYAQPSEESSIASSLLATVALNSMTALTQLNSIIEIAGRWVSAPVVVEFSASATDGHVVSSAE
jgi:hypothetical protein